MPEDPDSRDHRESEQSGGDGDFFAQLYAKTDGEDDNEECQAGGFGANQLSKRAISGFEKKLRVNLILFLAVEIADGDHRITCGNSRGAQGDHLTGEFYHSKIGSKITAKN